jgi:hypothetical protein
MLWSVRRKEEKGEGKAQAKQSFLTKTENPISQASYHKQNKKGVMRLAVALQDLMVWKLMAKTEIEICRLRKEGSATYLQSVLNGDRKFCSASRSLLLVLLSVLMLLVLLLVVLLLWHIILLHARREGLLARGRGRRLPMSMTMPIRVGIGHSPPRHHSGTAARTTPASQKFDGFGCFFSQAQNVKGGIIATDLRPSCGSSKGSLLMRCHELPLPRCTGSRL